MKLSCERREGLIEKALDLLDLGPGADRQTARESVLEVAEGFSRELERQDQAPRVAVLRKSLTSIENCAKELNRLLRKDWLTIVRAVEALNVLDLPSGGYEKADVWDALYGRPNNLSANLSSIVNTAHELKSRWRPDAGGRGSLHISTEGNAKFWLATKCYDIFCEFRDGAAKGTEGGPYYCFTTTVYELATGQEAEDVGLRSYVKKTAEFFNANNRLNKEMNVVRRQLRSPDLTPEKKISLEREKKAIKAKQKNLGRPIPF